MSEERQTRGARFENVDDDYDPPFAEEVNQGRYEIALGRFVVSYNRIEYLVGTILQHALSVLNRPDLMKAYERRGSLWFKLEILDAIHSTGKMPALQYIPFKALRAAIPKRNLLVHSHYDGNPFDDTYVLVPQERQRRADYLSPEEVEALARELDASYDKARSSEAMLAFAAHDAAEARAKAVAT